VDIELSTTIKKCFLFEKGPWNADKEVRMMMGKPQCYYVHHYVFKVLYGWVPPFGHLLQKWKLQS
jgi:hypothetical protein